MAELAEERVQFLLRDDVQHLEALQRMGPTDIHRRSFAPVRLDLDLEQSPLF